MPKSGVQSASEALQYSCPQIPSKFAREVQRIVRVLTQGGQLPLHLGDEEPTAVHGHVQVHDQLMVRRRDLESISLSLVCYKHSMMVGMGNDCEGRVVAPLGERTVRPPTCQRFAGNLRKKFRKLNY